MGFDIVAVIGMDFEREKRERVDIVGLMWESILNKVLLVVKCMERVWKKEGEEERRGEGERKEGEERHAFRHGVRPIQHISLITY